MHLRLCFLLGLGLASSAAQAAPEIAQLYAPKLPEGSAWVRVVNPSDSALQVRLNQGQDIALSAASTAASPFQAVDARQPLHLTVNGREVKGLKAPKDAWVTLILGSDPAAAPRLVIDPPPRGKDLRAELNVYNLNPGCANADLKLANGSKVFSQVPQGGQAQRTINPVQATLIASCGQSASLPLKLVPFKAGDRYSLFLVGSAQTPRLIGLVDQTAP
ncbi:alginate O-acetyltransferase [Pseudomonas sp. v388]|uniref:alginate O-acetyltransferase AlgF n=1 Tax=Pseudomonas sp. v388 TaxID=2479849 RepID=UPI000F7B07A1|nr:alginate O-acetyltransferase AlgF [Pseudomonas sp. v388]RRV03755.1 alginate O-acetyltransferase [Pseudomonas sp. v388]